LSEEISQKRHTLLFSLSLTLFPFTLSSIRDGPPLEGNYIKSLAELISLPPIAKFNLIFRLSPFFLCPSAK
jgi:hypothetical protein